MHTWHAYIAYTRLQKFNNYWSVTSPPPKHTYILSLIETGYGCTYQAIITFCFCGISSQSLFLQFFSLLQMISVTGSALHQWTQIKIDGQPRRDIPHIFLTEIADCSSVWWQKITVNYPQTISAAASWDEGLWAVCSGLCCWGVPKEWSLQSILWPQ